MKKSMLVFTFIFFYSLAFAASVALLPVASGVEKPVFVTQEPGGPLLIVGQEGQVYALQNKHLRLWLDISKNVSCCDERGLLGLAFHPGYARNRRFFLVYTDRRGSTVVEEYRGGKPFRKVLTIRQPYANHNGGGMAFGPDGYLYVATGDGGSNGDPRRFAQNPHSLLGKILRLDVDHGNPYAIPDDNPFVDNPAYRPEIWALGLRQPWRLSFDRESGDLYLGDQGQSNWEEVDFVPGPPADNGGHNFGWNVMEGNHCFKPAQNCKQAGLTLPILEYSHKQGCAVIGGYVYRGQAIPSLAGSYLFGDRCRGLIWAARWQKGWKTTLLLNSKLEISSFGQDQAGELYVVDYKGSVYKLVPAR